MTFRLADLPRGITDQILSFKGLSPSVLLLWMTGDSRLHHALATGLTTIDLVNKNRFVFCRFPTILKNLRALRELSLDRDHHALPCSTSIRDTIRNLSPTLIKIKIRVRCAGRHFATSSTPTLPSSTTDSCYGYSESSTTPIWTVRTAFPLLESLKLDEEFAFSPSDLLDLPDSLTCLSTVLSGFQYSSTNEEDHASIGAEFAINLPRSLTILKSSNVYGNGLRTDHYKHLPPHLVEFYNIPPSNDLGIAPPPEDVLALPRSLTKVSSEALPLSPPSTDLLHFPPNLKSVQVLSSYSFIAGSYVGTTIEADMGHIFPRLETLSGNCILSHSSLRSMPSTITSMYIRLDLNGITANDWPKSLTKLEIDPLFVTAPFQVLPANLQHLVIDFQNGDEEIGPKELALLPKSLLSLKCTCKDVNEVHQLDLPPNLDLPPKLTKLDLAIVFDNTTVHLYSGKETVFNRLNNRQLTSVPHRPKLVQCFPFASVPKSVTRLVVPCSLPASQLKHLPRRLKVLAAGLIFEDADFDPSAMRDKEALAEIRSIGRDEGIFLKNDSKTFSDAPSMMIALLPRTLESLEMYLGHLGRLKSSDWFEELPPRIHKLSLWQGAIDPDFLFKAPLQHIKELNIRLRAPTDDHIKALPRARGEIKIKDGSKLTFMAAVYWPHNDSSCSEVGWIHDMLNELSTRRHYSASEEDPTILRKLFGTDANDFAFLLSLK